LGSGDGRIVFLASLEFGTFSFGIECNKELHYTSVHTRRSLNLVDKVYLIKDDIFNIDLRQADIVTMYLTPTGNEKIRPKLENELKKGARVVTHDFSISGWEEVEKKIIRNKNRKHVLFKYIWKGN
jgi:hypothetical protein